MYSVQKLVSSPVNKRVRKIALLNVAIVLFLCFVLSLTTPFWSSIGLSHASKPAAKATSPLVRRINIPYFNNGAVPFNQTSVFWFGSVSSSTNYVDVRMGYNKSELYVDLHIVDLHVWYDSNAKSPNLATGDTATIYLNTAQNGGNTVDQSSYKFVAQVDWYQPRGPYQQAYKGNGNAWTASSIPFTTVSGWRGPGLNGPLDSGWTMTYHIPFSSLGKSASQLQGTSWNLAVKVQNQDSASTAHLPLTWWPEAASDTDPSSWGQLVFGLPTYQAPQTSNNTTYTVRNGLNKQVVTDGMVGGSLGCFNKGANRWTKFGGQSYPGANQINIQNEWDESDWNCFSKFYISFPLPSLSNGQGVASAKVTLYEYGNGGARGKSNPSLIQVASVDQGWNPSTLSWNNAPLVQENISRTVVNVAPVKIKYPGQAYTWDVSSALAAAYAAGQPLRLVFYSSDSAYSSGKYFYSSTDGSFNANGRPTLQATVGTVTGASGKGSTTSSTTASAASHSLDFALLFVMPAPLLLALAQQRRKILRQR